MAITKLSLSISLILLVLHGPVFAQGFNIQLPDTRPSQPYSNLDNFNEELTVSGTGSEFNVPVSRHHIIPYNLVRDFYNRVVENQRRQIIVGGFFRNLALNIGWFAYQQGVNCNNLETFHSLEIASGLSLMIANGQTSNSDSAILRPDGFDEFTEYYAWLPGNLFIGPTLRADDPGERFEENARYIIGEERFRMLSELRSQMEAYLNLGALPESVTLPYLRRVAVLLTQISKRNRVQPLNANQWKRRSDGKYIIVISHHIYNTSSVNKNDYILTGKCLAIKPLQLKTILNQNNRKKDEL